MAGSGFGDKDMAKMAGSGFASHFRLHVFRLWAAATADTWKVMKDPNPNPIQPLDRIDTSIAS